MQSSVACLLGLLAADYGRAARFQAYSWAAFGPRIEGVFASVAMHARFGCSAWETPLSVFALTRQKTLIF